MRLHPSTRLLAIDPGPAESAYVLWDGATIIAHGKIPNADLLSDLSAHRIEADQMAVEMIACYGMAVGSEVFETCVFIGRIWQLWGEYCFTRITRGNAKMHLCHSMKAKDANIRQALIDRLGAPGKKKTPGATFGIAGDEWAALAVAVTVWDQMYAEAA